MFPSSLLNLRKRITSSPKYSSLALLTLSVAHFVDDGLGRVITILTPFLRSTFNLNYLEVGLIGSVRSVTSALGHPLLGFASDKYGKRRLAMILGVLGYFVGSVALGFAGNFITALTLIFIATFAACVYHPQATSLLSFYFEKGLHKAIGIHGAFGAVGLVVSPIALSYVSDLLGWRLAPAIVFTPMIIIVMILFILILRDPEKNDETRLSNAGFAKNWLSIALLALYSGLHTMAFLNVGLFLPLYLADIRGLTIVEIGWWVALSSLGNIVGQFLAGFGAEKIGTRKMLLISSVLFGGFFFGFIVIDNIPLQLTLLVLSSAFNAASFPLVMSVATEIVPKGAVTTTMGIVEGISGAVRAVISPFMGSLADQMGLIFAMQLGTIPVFLSGFVGFAIRKKE